MSVSIIRVSTKELRQEKKDIERGAIRRLTPQVMDTPLEEGVESLVHGETSGKLASFLRGAVKESKGNVSTLAAEWFTPEEGERLQEISDELWRRSGSDSTPKVGKFDAVKGMVRFAESMLWRGKAATPLFEGEFGEARFKESLWYDTPKLRVPKDGGMSSEDSEMLIRRWLGLE